MARFFKKKDDDKKKKRGGGLFKRRKFCRFTAEKVEQIDYKDVDVLKEYIQENAKIMPARLTGTKALSAPAVGGHQARPLPGPAAVHRQPSIIFGRRNMQIILLEKVINLGNLGDVVKVKDGYARNFLIPAKMAKRATPAAMASSKRVAPNWKRLLPKTGCCPGVADKMNGTAVTVARKAGMDGRLFGSVGNADVAEALKLPVSTSTRPLSACRKAR